MTMGGLDFSQGSIMGIASIVVCVLSKTNIFLAVIGGIAAGAAIGAFNGFFYVNRKIKSFIVTICSMFLFRGLIKYIASNAPVAASMAVYDYDVPALKFSITAAVLLIGFIVFRYTKFGMYLKAIGAGEKAAKFAGIRTDRRRVYQYCKERLRYRKRRQPVGDTDSDRAGSGRNADFRRRKGSF